MWEIEILCHKWKEKNNLNKSPHLWETTKKHHATTKFRTWNNIYFKLVTHPNNIPKQPKPKKQTRTQTEACVPANPKTTTNKNKQNHTRKLQLGQEKTNQPIHIRGHNGKATWVHGVSNMEQRFSQISNAPY